MSDLLDAAQEGNVQKIADLIKAGAVIKTFVDCRVIF